MAKFRQREGMALDSRIVRHDAKKDVLAEIRFDSNCGVLAEDSGCVSHVTWLADGSISDTKSLPWTKVGSPTVQTTTPLFPRGFAQSPRVAATGFSASDYWALAAGSALEFTGDFTVTAIVKSKSTNGTRGIIGVGAGWDGGDGWNHLIGEARGDFLYCTPGVNREVVCSCAGTDTHHIVTSGRSGDTLYCKVDGRTTATSTLAATPTYGAVGTKIGNWVGYDSGDMYIYEILCTSTAFDETRVARIHRDFWRMNLQKNVNASVMVTTAADLRTITPKAGGASIILPVNTPSITENGWCLSPDASNTLYLQPHPLVAPRNGKDWAFQADIYSADWTQVCASAHECIFAMGGTWNPGCRVRFVDNQHIKVEYWQTSYYNDTYAIPALTAGTHNFLVGVTRGRAVLMIDGVPMSCGTGLVGAPGFTSFPAYISIGWYSAGSAYYATHLSFKNFRILNRMPGT